MVLHIRAEDTFSTASMPRFLPNISLLPVHPFRKCAVPNAFVVQEAPYEIFR